MGRRGYPAEFRRRVLGLLEGGRRVGQVACDFGISEQTIYAWLRQDRIDRGVGPGMCSAEHAEPQAARRRVREPETELAMHRRATEILREGVRPNDDTRRSE
jgi:transposase